MHRRRWMNRDGQTGTEGQTERWTDGGQRHGEKDRTDRDGQTERWTERDGQTERWTDRWTDGEMDRRRDGQTERWTGPHTGMQEDI